MNKERLGKFLWLCRERHEIYLRKSAGQPTPWTDDPLLSKYHFCNVFRRLDKTSVEIYELIGRQPSSVLMLQAAILGRLINRHGSVSGAWDVLTSGGNLAEYVERAGLNTNAYHLNTPHGLNSFSGVAELCHQERSDLDHRLRNCSSLEEAHAEISKERYIGGFMGYQVLLDLYDNGYFDQPFDGGWALAGPGACRGMLHLLGEDLNYDWKSAEFRKDKGSLLQKMQGLLRGLTEEVLKVWPQHWPEFTIHETEFMLCEWDKYVRKSLGKPSGRLYKGAKK